MKAKVNVTFYYTFIACLFFSWPIVGRIQEHLAQTLEDTLTQNDAQEQPSLSKQLDPLPSQDAPKKEPLHKKNDDVASILQKATDATPEPPMPMPKKFTQNFENDLTGELAQAQQPEEQAAAPREPKTALDKLNKRKEVVEKEKKVKPANDDKIEFHFEDADLSSLLDQISQLYDYTFITDDSIYPPQQNKKGVKGNKISFKTHKALSKKEAWDLFLVFIDIMGLAVVPGPQPNVFRIMATEEARKSAIPAYIGTNPKDLPDNDQLIRFVYFVKNCPLDTVVSIINSLRSVASSFFSLTDLNAFVLTDKSYNIKSLMRIIEELDKVTMPQAMSVLRLKRVDAEDVRRLYDSIIGGDTSNPSARFFPQRKPSTALYFPENARIITEPRSNSLILLGSEDAIKKIENFITQYIDVDMGKPYSPLRVYALKYADAVSVATLMNELVKFSQETEAGKTGGTRGGDKYFKPMTFTAEPATNRLIIKGDEEDFLRAKEILARLDEPQPQVAVEVLIISLHLDKEKQLGSQIRTKQNGAGQGLLGQNVTFQTSGITINGGAPSGIVTNPIDNPGINRLMGNLINLIGPSSIANTVVSLGSDAFGLWGIFHVLEQVTDARAVANPFLVAVNKKQSKVIVGEIRRVIAATVVGGATTENSQTNDEANLSVQVTPQINSDGMIVLDLDIQLNQYTDPLDFTSATKTTRQVKTNVIVADREVIALGGLIKDTVSYVMSKVPVLGDIPILGWLFKNKSRSIIKDNLLILISTRIIPPNSTKAITEFTQTHITEYANYLNSINDPTEKRDPVNRAFFEDKQGGGEDLDKFIFERNIKERKKSSLAKKKKAKEKRDESKRDVTPVREGMPT